MNNYEQKRLQAMLKLGIARSSWLREDGNVYVPENNAYDDGAESPYVPELTFNFRPYTKQIIEPHSSHLQEIRTGAVAATSTPHLFFSKESRANQNKMSHESNSRPTVDKLTEDQSP